MNSNNKNMTIISFPFRIARIFCPVLVFVFGFGLGLSKTFMIGHFHQSQCFLYEETYRHIEELLKNGRHDELINLLESFCRTIEAGESRKSYMKLNEISTLNDNLQNIIVNLQEHK